MRSSGRKTAWAMALVASGAQAALPPVGVLVDRAHFTQEERGANGFDATWYPAGQSAASWEERLQVRRVAAGAAHTIEDAEAAQHAQAKAECPNLVSQRLPSQPPAPAPPIWFWHCEREAPALDRFAIVRPVLIEATLYLAQAQFQGDAPPGKIPLAASLGMDRAVEFLSRFEACTSLTGPGCVAPEAIAGTWGELAPSAEDARQIALASRRGRAMYRQDQLAWHATDYARERKLVREKKTGGFLSVPGEGRGGSTYFITLRGERIGKVVRVDTDPSGRVAGSAKLKALPDDVLPRWRARQTAIASPELQLCATANTLVLPTEDGQGWWVYVMSSSPSDREVFLGGHNRVRVDAAGERVLSVEHSARSCIAIDAERMRAQRDGESGFFSHIVSPWPWETDVMQALTFGVTLIRVAESGVWRIEGDQLHKHALEAPDAAPPKESKVSADD